MQNNTARHPIGGSPWIREVLLVMGGAATILEIVQQLTSLLDRLPSTISTLITVVFWSMLVLFLLYVAVRCWRAGTKARALFVFLPAAVIVALYGFAYGWFGGTPQPHSIVVFPFSGPDGITSESHKYSHSFAYAIDDAAGLNLLDSDLPRTFDPRRSETLLNYRSAKHTARRLGAEMFVLGEYDHEPGRGWRLKVRLVNTADRREMASSEVSRQDSSQSAIDELARTLLFRYRRQGIFRASAYRGPMSAFKATFNGEIALRDGQFTRARRYFQQAIDVDDSYSPAWYGLSAARLWSDEDEGAALTAIQQAHRAIAKDRSRFSERDTLLIRAVRLSHEGAIADATRALELILEQDRYDVEANYQMGELQFHFNPLRSRPASDSRDSFARVLRLEERHYRAQHYLLRLALRSGDRPAARRLLRQMMAAPIDSTYAAALVAVDTSLVTPPDSGLTVVQQLVDAPNAALTIAATLFTERWRGDLDGPAARVHLDRIVDAMVDHSDRRLSDVGWEMKAVHSMTRGQWDETLEALDSLRSQAPTQLVQSGLFASLPFVNLPEVVLSRTQRNLSSWQPPVPRSPSLFHASRPASRDFLLGMISLRLGDTASVLNYVTRLESVHLHQSDGLYWPLPAVQLSHDLAQVLRAELLLARKDSTGGLELLTAIRSLPPRLVVRHPLYSRVHGRFLRGLVLRDVGRTEEALAEFRSVIEEDQINPYMPVAHLQLGEIYATRGQAELAERERNRFEAYWSDADAGIADRALLTSPADRPGGKPPTGRPANRTAPRT